MDKFKVGDRVQHVGDKRIGIVTKVDGDAAPWVEFNSVVIRCVAESDLQYYLYNQDLADRIVAILNEADKVCCGVAGYNCDDCALHAIYSTNSKGIRIDTLCDRISSAHDLVKEVE